MKRSRARSPAAINFARTERATSNDFAQTIWQWVRNRQIHGQKFRREVPIPPYTVDFCCLELKLILEVDGAEHFTVEGQQHDRDRDEFLRQHGYHVVRIVGYDILQNGRQVLEKIVSAVEQRIREQQNPSPPTPLP
jgi:very-short-patch-repair endonuclease